MTLCDDCGKEIESETLEQVGKINTGGLYVGKSKPAALPFECHRCGGKYCSTHRLPESHRCKNIELLKNPPRKAYLDEPRTAYIPRKIDGNPEVEYETCAHCGKSKVTYNVTYQRCNICNKYYCFLHREPKHHNCHKLLNKKSWINSPFSSSNYIFIFVIMMSANIIFPLFLPFMHPDMLTVIGNPRPIYFYDIDSSCSYYASEIQLSLDYLSGKTKVKFIYLPSPIALLIGGIHYNCNGSLTNKGASGEAESGAIGGSYLIIIWNKVRLLDNSKTTILHETLHVMGFGHNKNPESIMYPYAKSNIIDKDISDFISKIYVNNLYAYLNIIPINLFYEAFVIYIIIFMLFEKTK